MATLIEAHQGTIDAHDLQDLLAWMGGPCVSIYMPTTYRFNEAQEMQTRFRQLCDEAERRLDELHLAPGQRDAMMEELRRLGSDPEFFRRQFDGLAVFRSPDRFAHYRLLRSPRQGAHVADSLPLAADPRRAGGAAVQRVGA